jgi:hypothetical protein
MKWTYLTRKHAIYYKYHDTGIEVLSAMAVAVCYLLLSCLVILDPEDGGNMFLRNIR